MHGKSVFDVLPRTVYDRGFVDRRRAIVIHNRLPVCDTLGTDTFCDYDAMVTLQL